MSEDRPVIGDMHGQIMDLPAWNHRAEPALLVEVLERQGVDATLEELAALPLAVELSDDVEAERVAQLDAKSETDR